MRLREACPQCGSSWHKKNGHIHTGKHNHRCKLCGRAFVLTPENSVITEEQRVLVERLLQNFAPWDLPRRGRWAAVALAIYERAVSDSL
jgi:transposase-like protein